MTVNQNGLRHARRSHKSPSRHAADVIFHLRQALHSLEAVHVLERRTRIDAGQLLADIRDAKASAEHFHHAVISEQTRKAGA